MPERPQYPILTQRDATIPFYVSNIVNLAMAGKTNNVLDVYEVVWTSPLTIRDERITRSRV